jgi:hypothetical protein
MNWQLMPVALAVAAAALYLALSAWKTWWGKSGCAGGCGCGRKVESGSTVSGHSVFISSDSLKIRRQIVAGDEVERKID